MKTIILAGGWGTRLGRLTEAIPKPMVPVGGHPILWHIMKTYAHHGFDDFVIALGVNGHIIRDYFYHYAMRTSDFTVDLARGEVAYHGQRDGESWRVTLADTGLDTLKGGRIKRLEPYLDAGVNMLTYGDGLADDKILTLTGVRPPARFGELVEREGRLLHFEEKPQTSVGLVNGGYMVFDRPLLDHLTPDERCDFEAGALEQLAEGGNIMVYEHTGRWECMDHERDVSRLNRLWRDGRAFWKVWP
jgi:glucose-1-phosphate cytidylyltransferase